MKIILFLTALSFLLQFNWLSAQEKRIKDFQKVGMQPVENVRSLKPKEFIDTTAVRPSTKRPSSACITPVSAAYTDKYRLISNYIPQKGDSIKYININFNIFQDYWGNNNFEPSENPAERERLLNMLAWINEIYAKQPYCTQTGTANSDPPQGVSVTDLPHKYIQFRLHGIYTYRDSTENEGLWKSNNPKALLNRIAATDSSRLNQLNILFTEKYFMGSVRDVKVLNKGRKYAHPEVLLHSTEGQGAIAIAKVDSGKIKSIEVLNAGSGYKEPVMVVIKGANGTGAMAKAHLNEANGSIMRIEVTAQGNGYNFTKIECKGGGGAGTVLYPGKIEKGRLTSVIVAQRGFSYTDTPEIIVTTDSEGHGAILEPVLQGATGFTVTPSTANADLYIIEKSLWNKGVTLGDYAAATNIAHELGHVLDLLHTYSSGSETSSVSHFNYMPDLFGIPFGGFDIIDWGRDPCLSPTDKVSNNLMGGNQISQYASPMQIGKMHRALHLFNIRKYTDCTCDLNQTHSINTTEAWDFSYRSYNPIVVTSTGSLTIQCLLEMPDNCTITVENGGSLVIMDGGNITGAASKAWNGTIHIKKGGQFVIMPGGAVNTAVEGNFLFE